MPVNSKFTGLCARFRFVDDPIAAEPDSCYRQQLVEYIARTRSDGLRITSTITPLLHSTLCEVAEELGIVDEPEGYVISDPRPNAGAPALGASERPLVILSSGLVTLLTSTELAYVIGHELGHLGLGHMATPLDMSFESEFEALKVRSQARCAEISADRIGLLAVRSLLIAGNVMVKMASGLTSDFVRLDVKAFLNQLGRRPEEVNREWELDRLHPSLPLRLWALIQFSQTEAYLRHTGTGDTGMSLSEVDGSIAERLGELGDGRLSKVEDRLVDIATTWVGAALVLDDGIIEEHEEVKLKELIGDELATKALVFAKANGIDAVLDKLAESIRKVEAGDKVLRRRVWEAHRSFAEKLDIPLTNCRSWKIVGRLVRDDR